VQRGVELRRTRLAVQMAGRGPSNHRATGAVVMAVWEAVVVARIAKLHRHP
jgi:hypothetical protein